MNRYALCPCDTKKFYQKCCGQYHAGAYANSALTLMRSRFSAYALDCVDYIIETTHPKNPQYLPDLAAWKQDLHRFSQETRFIFLKILEVIDGDEIAYVSFTACLTQGSHDATFSEKSTFVKEDGRWFYRNGESLAASP